MSRLDDDEKGVVLSDTLGRKQNMAIVNEPGLYSLILSSMNPVSIRLPFAIPDKSYKLPIQAVGDGCQLPPTTLLRTILGAFWSLVIVVVFSPLGYN